MPVLCNSLLKLLLILISVSAHSQSNNLLLENSLWYQQNVYLLDDNDTILLKPQITNYSFKLWQFKKNSLIISNGTLRQNNPSAKCFSSVKHYRWELIEETGNQKLLVSLGDSIRLYEIVYSDSTMLRLIKLNISKTKND